MASPHVGDIGTVFELEVRDQDGAVVDISLATGLIILFESPAGVDKVKTAVLSGSGTDGKMRYVTVAGDLDEDGRWQIQGKVTFSAAQVFYTDIQSFTVQPNLDGN